MSNLTGFRMKMLMQVLTLMMTVMFAVVSGSGVGFARHLKRDAVEGECGIGHFGGILKSISQWCLDLC